jgi:hypothetical protein
MARENQNSISLRQALIVGLILLCAGLVLAELGTNVLDFLRERRPAAVGVTPTLPMEPTEPFPETRTPVPTRSADQAEPTVGIFEED